MEHCGTMPVKNMMDEVVELDSLRAMRRTLNERVVAKIKLGEAAYAIFDKMQEAMAMVPLPSPGHWSLRIWTRCHSPE